MFQVSKEDLRCQGNVFKICKIRTWGLGGFNTIIILNFAECNIIFLLHKEKLYCTRHHQVQYIFSGCKKNDIVQNKM